MDNNGNFLGGLSGAALAGVAWFARLDDDTQRRLRNLRDDTNDAIDKIDGWLASPDVTRLLISTVRDFIVGIAYAAQPTTPAQTIPNLEAGLSRPNLSLESAARSYAWPPKAGTYDESGRVSSVGELTPFSLMLTYQEVRAAINGITQATVPTADGLAQIWRVYHSLTEVAASLGLTLDQYRAVWKQLFGQAAGFALDAHQDPAKPPIATSIFGGLTIVPLTSLPGGVPGYSYANRNTDSVMRYRITAPGGGVGAGQPIATVVFGQEYRYRDANNVLVPFQPGIPLAMSNLTAGIGATSIGSTGFTLVNKDILVGSSVHDVTITVNAGLASS